MLLAPTASVIVYFSVALSRCPDLLHSERLAVGTLIHSRVVLVSSHSYTVKAAIVTVTAVMCAVRYRTFNAFVCAFCAHFSSLRSYFDAVCPQSYYARKECKNAVSQNASSGISVFFYQKFYCIDRAFYRAFARLTHLVGKSRLRAFHIPQSCEHRTGADVP